MVRSHISNCDGEKLLSSAKGFHLNSFDLLPSVGVLQLISNNLWPCESFDDLHKQCYLPITAAEKSDSKDGEAKRKSEKKTSYQTHHFSPKVGPYFIFFLFDRISLRIEILKFNALFNFFPFSENKQKNSNMDRFH